MYVASKCAVTTTLAAAAGGVTVLVVDVGFGNPPDVAPALNGELVCWSVNLAITLFHIVSGFSLSKALLWASLF